MAKFKDGKVFTNPVRLSYANVFEPKAINGTGEAKYSVSLIIPKEDKETLAVIKEAIEEAKEYGKEKKWGGKVPKNLKMPVRDGDEDRNDDENYADSYFINANAPAKRPPKLLTRVKDVEATEDDIYSGVYAVAVITFFPYDSNGNRGIACGLQGLQFYKHGERLSGGGFNTNDLEFDDPATAASDLPW